MDKAYLQQLTQAGQNADEIRKHDENTVIGAVHAVDLLIKKFEGISEELDELIEQNNRILGV